MLPGALQALNNHRIGTRGTYRIADSASSNVLSPERLSCESEWLLSVLTNSSAMERVTKDKLDNQILENISLFPRLGAQRFDLKLN